MRSIWGVKYTVKDYPFLSIFIGWSINFREKSIIICRDVNRAFFSSSEFIFFLQKYELLSSLNMLRILFYRCNIWLDNLVEIREILQHKGCFSYKRCVCWWQFFQKTFNAVYCCFGSFFEKETISWIIHLCSLCAFEMQSKVNKWDSYELA